MPADRRSLFSSRLRDTGTQTFRRVGAWGGHAYRSVGHQAGRGPGTQARRGGARDETSRDWRIRWNSRIALSPTNQLKVEDEGESFIITNMVEVIEQRGAPDLRRKFLDLQGIHS